MTCCAPPAASAASPALDSKHSYSLVHHPRGDDREAAVDVGDLAGDRARKIRQQKRRDVADLVDRDITPKRRVLFYETLDLGEAADPGSSQRLDGSRRDAVDAYSLGTERCCEITNVRLKARLRKSHDVVVRQCAQRAEVAERQHRGAAPLHQRASALRKRREAVRTH